MLNEPCKHILQFLAFKLDIAQTYLAATEDDEDDDGADSESSEECPPQAKRRHTVEIPAAPQRTSAAKHLPEMNGVKNSMRCRMHGCSFKSKVRCVRCNVFLCMTADRNCLVLVLCEVF